MPIETVVPVFNVRQNGMMISVYHADKGQGLPKHDHPYSHLTFCHAGSIIIRKDGREKTLSKTSGPLNLRAVEWHEIESVEDGTVFVNVFAVHNEANDTHHSATCE